VAPETSADSASAAKKPCLNGAGVVPSVISDDNSAAALPSHDNRAEEECVDDKELVRNTLIVRLPTQAPNAPASSVIVIDDSDEEETDEPCDVKPDREQLDEQLVERPAADVGTADRKPLPTATTTDPSNTTTMMDQSNTTTMMDQSNTTMMMDQSNTTTTSDQSNTTTTSDQSNHIEREDVAPDCNGSTSTEHNSQTSGPNAAGGGASSGKVKAAHSSSHRPAAENVQPAVPPGDSDSRPSSSSTAGSSQRRRSSKSTPGATQTQDPEAGDKCSGKKSFPDKQRPTEAAVRHACTQTIACIRPAEQQLNSLRSNVLQLLKTIVPTLNCNNLEFVDELVVEMVRVNAESSEIGN